MNRRDFISSSLFATSGALLTQCSPPAPSANGPFAGKTIRIFTYSGSKEKGLREIFVPLFEKQTGAKVIVDPGWWDSIPKLKASPPGKPAFDLVLTDATQGYPAIKEGMFKQLDFDRIPNYKNVVPAALDNWIVKDQYGITFPDSPLCVGYNKNIVKEAPSSWKDLLKDEFKGKLGFYNHFYVSLFSFAAMKASLENVSGTAAKMMNEDLQGVINFAKEHRDRIKLWWPTSTDMAMNLANGSVALGNIHGTDMRVAMKNSSHLDVMPPSTDRAAVQLMWVIPHDTPESDLAHEAINTLLSEEVQLAFARLGLATAIPKVAETVASEDPIWKAIFPNSLEQLSTAQYYPYDLYSAHWDELVKVWDREILRKSS